MRDDDNHFVFRLVKTQIRFGGGVRFGVDQ